MNSSHFNKKSKLYDKFRPDYPPTILRDLKKEFGLKLDGVDIVEFGCGTGKFTEKLIDNANRLYVVDNNNEMLSTLLQKFDNYPSLTSVYGSAENSCLPSSCADLIVCAQSFHHFSSQQAITEFNRILKPKGNILLLWYFSDIRKEISKDILKSFYKTGRTLNQRKRVNIDFQSVSSLFQNKEVIFKKVSSFQQEMDNNEFIGSMKSSSYAPTNDDLTYSSYIDTMNCIFMKYQKNQKVILNFDLHVYLVRG